MSDHRNSTALPNVKTGDELILTRSDVAPSAALMAAIEEVERTHTAWESSVPKDVDLPNNDEGKAFDAAERRLITFPCRSYADVLAKVSYLHHRKTDAAVTTYCASTDAEFAESFMASLIGIPAEEAEFQEPVGGTTDGSSLGFAAGMVKGLDLSGVSDTGWMAVYDGLTLAAHGIEGIMQRPQCQGRDELNAAGLYLQAISDFLFDERRRAMEMLIRRPFNPVEDPHMESMMALQWLAYESDGERFDELESFVTIARDRHRAHEEYRTGKVVRA